MRPPQWAQNHKCNSKRQYPIGRNTLYSFARRPKERDNKAPPPICVSELFAAVLILLEIRIDLQRPWLGLFCATDASQVLGFGASQLSRLSDWRHDLVRLQRDKDVSMSQNAIAKELRTTSESRSLLSKLSFVNGPALELLERLKQQD